MRVRTWLILFATIFQALRMNVWHIVSAQYMFVWKVPFLTTPLRGWVYRCSEVRGVEIQHFLGPLLGGGRDLASWKFMEDHSHPITFPCLKFKLPLFKGIL
jgi:hypothetical protein